jgi:hypothetical protein
MTQPISHSSNRMLASLAGADLTALLPHLRFSDLPKKMVLFEAGGTIDRIYFLTLEWFPSSLSWRLAT